VPVANPRVHATTRTVVNEAFAEEKLSLQALPGPPYRAVLRLERRTSHDGMVSDRRQSLPRARHHPAACLRRPCSRRRNPHLRGRRAGRKPCAARRARPDRKLTSFKGDAVSTSAPVASTVQTDKPNSRSELNLAAASPAITNHALPNSLYLTQEPSLLRRREQLHLAIGGSGWSDQALRAFG
jgi:hypothetical protein